MTILLNSVVVNVLVADDNHSSDDDCPLHPNYSKQVAAVAEEVAHRNSAYDVGWVYHHHHYQLLSRENVVVKKNNYLYCEKKFYFFGLNQQKGIVFFFKQKKINRIITNRYHH